ncbi:MAG: AAA family ATPase [Parasphingorhabdus sp.]|uniref:AAA family ATPase n=1 Tax=Parasphingorhabdus sp. TaxID=2709688 RepID=UPI003296F789
MVALPNSISPNNIPDKWRIPLSSKFSCFPVKSNDKKPVGSWKRWQTERPDQSRIETWAAEESNVGIATGAVSGCIVLDLDSDRAVMDAEARGLPTTVKSKTAKGMHVFFKHPGGTIANRANLLPGVDIRGDGGYVVAPGSVHPSGATYQWLNSPESFELAEIPAWLAGLLKPTKQNQSDFHLNDNSAYGEAALDSELSALRRAPEGERNDQLNRTTFAASQLAHGGEIESEKTKALIASTANAIGLDEDEVEATLNSAWEAGAMNPRSASDRLSKNPREALENTATDVDDALPLVWFDDVEPNLDNLWLIKGLLPQTGLALIYGHPDSGKSFLALDIAFHVAMGSQWHDLKTEKGLVVYVGAEGLAGLRNRMVAFRQHHNPVEPMPFALIPTPIDMQGANADTPKLIAAIRQACEDSGHEPRLIIIDTISKTFGAGKENTDDMASYVANCGRVAAEFDCCVMPVHHRPKDSESKDPRGHSSLRGGCDTILLVENGQTKKATVFKQKDGEGGQSYLFNLKTVQLGFDNDGEPVTSCIVQPTKNDLTIPVSVGAMARRKLNDGQKLALSELGKAIENHGISIPDEVPDDRINRKMITKVVRIKDWADSYFAVTAADADSADKKPDTAKRTFRRYKEKLQTSEIIGIWEDWAWIL